MHGGSGGTATYRTYTVVLKVIQGLGTVHQGCEHHVRLSGQCGHLFTGRSSVIAIYMLCVELIILVYVCSWRGGHVHFWAQTSSSTSVYSRSCYHTIPFLTFLCGSSFSPTDWASLLTRYGVCMYVSWHAKCSVLCSGLRWAVQQKCVSAQELQRDLKSLKANCSQNWYC